MTTDAGPSLLDQIREAFSNRDLHLLAPLLADDVRWGDDGRPRGCRSPADVPATFAQLMDRGVEGEIVELAQGGRGVLCELAVRWPEGMSGRSSVWQVYLLTDGKIAEIRGYDDRSNAAEAAGLS